MTSAHTTTDTTRTWLWPEETIESPMTLPTVKGSE